LTAMLLQLVTLGQLRWLKVTNLNEQIKEGEITENRIRDASTWNRQWIELSVCHWLQLGWLKILVKAWRRFAKGCNICRKDGDAFVGVPTPKN
jgi:hypothetical protein